MISQNFSSVVMQPTTVCNADCTYCYLMHRHENNVMSVSVSESVARSIEDQNAIHRVDVVWHGGEPLAVGLRHFQRLIEPFNVLEKQGRVRHVIQTNGILIDDDWCRFFAEHKFQIGVSLDGPIAMNSRRIDRKGTPFFDKTMKGISFLKSNALGYAIIAVVSTVNLSDTTEFYNFFVELGCEMLCINIEEQEGANLSSTVQDNNEVKIFWEELFAIWKSRPLIQIREFEQVLSYVHYVLSKSPVPRFALYDPFPTIAWNGDVTILSPELSGVSNEHYADFVSGNILKQSLQEILVQSIEGRVAIDYLKGIADCKNSCAFFDFCGGGQASNKFFEHGSISTTETRFCINAKQLPFNAVLSNA